SAGPGVIHGAGGGGDPDAGWRLAEWQDGAGRVRRSEQGSAFVSYAYEREGRRSHASIWMAGSRTWRTGALCDPGAGAGAGLTAGPQLTDPHAGTGGSPRTRAQP